MLRFICDMVCQKPVFSRLKCSVLKLVYLLFDCWRFLKFIHESSTVFKFSSIFWSNYFLKFWKKNNKNFRLKIEIIVIKTRIQEAKNLAKKMWFSLLYSLGKNKTFWVFFSFFDYFSFKKYLYLSICLC